MVSKYPQETIKKKVSPLAGGGFLDVQGNHQFPKIDGAPINPDGSLNPKAPVFEVMPLPKATKILQALKGVVSVLQRTAFAFEHEAPSKTPPGVVLPAEKIFSAPGWTYIHCSGAGAGSIYRTGTQGCGVGIIQHPPLNPSSFPKGGSGGSIVRVWEDQGPWNILGQHRFEMVGRFQPSGTQPFWSVKPMPIGYASPLTWPKAWPIAEPQPQVQPWGKPDPGTKVETLPKPTPNPAPFIVPVPLYEDVPVTVVNQPPPNTGWWFAPPTVVIHGNGRVTTRPPDPAAKPPEKGQKQKKVNIAQLGGALWVAINAVTEGLDFVEVLWDALPEHLKRKKIREERYGKYGYHSADLQSKMEDVYDHIDEIDVAQAVVGYINNAVEDWFFGVQGIPTKKLSQQLGIATGLDRAIAQAQKSYAIDQGFSLSDIVPTIDYDDATGVVTITSPFGQLRVVDVK